MIQKTLSIQTRQRGLVDITWHVANFLVPGAYNGICHCFIKHTSASLIICENADPKVLQDLETFMSGVVPDKDKRFLHTAEGPDDMPAHIRSVLTQTDLSIPIVNGTLGLGTWQGIFLWEHRLKGCTRELIVTLIR